MNALYIALPIFVALVWVVVFLINHFDKSDKKHDGHTKL